MRQSKYDKPLLQQESIGNGDGKQIVANFENRVELGMEGERLAELLTSVRTLVEELHKSKGLLSQATYDSQCTIRALLSVGTKVQNVIKSVDAAVDKACKATVSVRQSNDDERRLAAHRKNLVENEEKMFDHYIDVMKEHHDRHWDSVYETFRNRSCIYLTGLSQKFFLVSYIVLLIYFCTTVTCFLLTHW